MLTVEQQPPPGLACSMSQQKKPSAVHVGRGRPHARGMRSFPLTWVEEVTVHGCANPSAVGLKLAIARKQREAAAMSLPPVVPLSCPGALSPSLKAACLHSIPAKLCNLTILTCNFPPFPDLIPPQPSTQHNQRPAPPPAHRGAGSHTRHPAELSSACLHLRLPWT